jgi:hypothetical protein
MPLAGDSLREDAAGLKTCLGQPMPLRYPVRE